MRLIDADRLKEVFERDTVYDYHHVIDIAPTEESVPISVIEDIKTEIETEKRLQITAALESEDRDKIYTHLRMAQTLAVALEIIEKHISRKDKKE